MSSVDTQKLLRGLDVITDDLLSLADPIEIEDALKNEGGIIEMARQCGVDEALPASPMERGLALARMEQKCRMKKAGITYMGKSLTAIYSIPTKSDDVTTELVFDYTGGGELKRAYTRTVNRNGDRWAIQIDHNKALRLEQLFGLHDDQGLKERAKSAQRQRLA